MGQRAREAAQWMEEHIVNRFANKVQENLSLSGNGEESEIDCG